MIESSWLGRLALFLLLAILVATPWWATGGVLFLIGLLLINGLFALSWHLLFGYTGLGSFGHAGFFAIGAYLVGAGLRYQADVWFPLLLLGSAVAGAIAACIVGAVAIGRLSGIFLAVLTVAFSEMLRRAISYIPALGGEDGLANITRPKIGLGVAVLDLGPSAAMFWFILAAVALTTAAVWWLVHSPYGRVFTCIRDNPERAEFLGLNLKFYRVMSFTISGGIAAIAGGLFAPWTQIVTLDEVHWLNSLQPVLNTFLGGIGSFWGPYVGAAAFMMISYLSRGWAGTSELLVGAVLLLVILVAPMGIIGTVKSVAEKLLRRMGREPTGAPPPTRPDSRSTSPQTVGAE